MNGDWREWVDMLAEEPEWTVDDFRYDRFPIWYLVVSAAAWLILAAVHLYSYVHAIGAHQ